MALFADGWHMATHAGAIGIAAFTYWYARSHAHDPRFSFGTGKLGELAAFASALILGMIALFIGYESAVRFVQPVSIAYGEAIFVAALGLAVNLVCAWLLRDGDTARQHSHAHAHHHEHEHEHEHHAHGRDNNLRAAFIHVVADAATSVLAIAALVLAATFAWTWIDPAVGLVGAVMIAVWSFGLARDSGRVLLDIVPDRAIETAIRERLERDGDEVCDLHLWQVGPGHRAAVVSIVSREPHEPNLYKERLAGLPGLSHVTIEVQRRPLPARVA
jgi:cation diffusion facilitator family transporter